MTGRAFYKYIIIIIIMSHALGPVGSWGMRWRNRSSGHCGRRGTGCHSVIGYSRKGEKDGGGIGPSPLQTRFGMLLVYLTSCDQHLGSLGRPDQEVEAPTDNHLWESYAEVRDMQEGNVLVCMILFSKLKFLDFFCGYPRRLPSDCLVRVGMVLPPRQ